MYKLISFLLLGLLILSACTKENGDPIVEKEKLTGYVQKGPFNSGTNITISELHKDLSQTGRTYTTQITNNSGNFELGKLELVSGFLSFRSDGFYFNEVLGETSASQLTLLALSNVSDKSVVNLNVLSHLEKPRVEYLISQHASFIEAKSQAQAEVLQLFDFFLKENEASEQRNIAQEGDDNAILLASSLILQGYRSVGELSELLSYLSQDLKEDGILSDSSLGSQLINHAIYLDTASIRQNLEDRYEELGVPAEIPYFEKYLMHFLQTSGFEITSSLINYPRSGLYGLNILDLQQTSYSGEKFSLAANLAEGTKLQIKITALSGGPWFYSVSTVNNWSITTFDDDAQSQTFTAIDSDRSCDLRMGFNPGEFLVEYFEMGATIPSRTKTISR